METLLESLQVFLFKLILIVIATLAPIHHLVFTVIFLIFSDLITGLAGARRLGIPITSSAMSTTIGKLFVYNAALITSHITEIHMLNDLPITKLVACYIGLVELTSILENLNKIHCSPVLRLIILRLSNEHNKLKKEQQEEEDKYGC